jgi:hypothetical protein
MRGLFLQQPLEFRLNVTGDSFSQGAQIPCSLTVKNHGETPVHLQDLTLTLALGNLKKIKGRDEGAFEILQTADLDKTIQVPPGSEVSLPHTFSLDANAPITDKNQSPYLLYGNSTEVRGLGQLLVTVAVHPHIRTIFDTMTTVFNFINKGESSKGGAAIGKFKAPDSRRFSLVDELNLSASFTPEGLDLQFAFAVRKFDHGTSKVAVKKGKLEVRKSLASADYLFGGGFVRQEYIEQIIKSALAEVSSGF